MQKIQRPKCAINNSDILYPIYTFKNFPVSMSCVDTPAEDDIVEDMKWGYSQEGHIQLLEMLDPSLIYDNYHNPGTVGKVWQEHHTMFSQFIKQDEFLDVLEIGGGSGNLVKNFLDVDKNFKWTIVEPSARAMFNDSRIEVVNGYFENLSFDKKFDVVVHSHCFEHVYNPISFLNKISNLLDYGNLHYISIPNMKHWIENGFSNALHFEHTFYVDIDVLTHLLAKAGFRVVDQIVQPHSIFVKAVKSEHPIISDIDFTYVKTLFENYLNRQAADVAQINQSLNNRQCFLFGGHIFSQVLLNIGINESQVINILDNDPLKHGKRLYGTQCIVCSPAVLKDIDSPIVVLRGGPYTEEIKQSILKINPTTEIL